MCNENEENNISSNNILLLELADFLILSATAGKFYLLCSRLDQTSLMV